MSDESFNLYNKRVSPTKNDRQQQEISYLEREMEGDRKRERKICKTVGVHGSVRACSWGGDCQKERKIERGRERPTERKKNERMKEKKNPEQTVR